MATQEYRAISEACKECVWLMDIARELKIKMLELYIPTVNLLYVLVKNQSSMRGLSIFCLNSFVRDYW